MKWIIKEGVVYRDGIVVPDNKRVIYLNSYEAMIDQKNTEISELKTTIAKLKKGLARHYKEQVK